MIWFFYDQSDPTYYIKWALSVLNFYALYSCKNNYNLQKYCNYLFKAKPTAAPDDFGEELDTAAQAAGALGAGMMAMAMMTPDLNFQQNAGAPSSSIQPGSVGGGGLPSDGGISTAALSLALVPLGLSAVAIFPPFAT